MKKMRMRFTPVLVVLILIFCPASQSIAESGPEILELDALENLYEPVTFDHASHVDFADGNCSECHHHTTGAAPTDPNCLRCHPGGEESDTISCFECHSDKRFEAAYLAEIAASPHLYHTDKPGLKGAYHQNCMGCHKKMDAPTGCQDCHVRNDKGDRFFRSGKYAPEPVDTSSGH